MKLIIPLLFLQLCQANKNFEECIKDNNLRKNVWEIKLEDKIMCNYDANIPPKPFNNSDSIDITPDFLVKSFKFSSEDQVFSVFTMTILGWKDERLKWDPNDYNGISETLKNGFRFWLPGIKLYNAVNDFYDQSSDMYMPCRISSSGSIACVSYIQFQASCVIDLSHWPFDTQVCSLEFGPWIVSGNKMRLYVKYNAVSFIGSKNGAEWDIMDVKEENKFESERQLKIFFTLMRHSESIAAIVIFPTILLSVLTFSTLFLDVRRDSRVHVSCFSLLCHFFFLSELGMDIPEHSKSTPTILLFYRGSVIMTIISIMLTFVMKYLSEKNTPVPKAIAIANDNVYKGHGKLFIYPHWVVRDDDDKKEHIRAWSDFVSILNSIWIYVSLIAYIVMCCVYIPLPSNLKQKIYSMGYDFE